jgi:hypothetical protein
VGAATAAVCRSQKGEELLVLPECVGAAVLRHPRVDGIGPQQEAELTMVLESIAGRKVQPYSRLGRLSSAAGSLEPAAEVVLQAMDFVEAVRQERTSSRRAADEGRFCSEVVVEVLSELGVTVFEDGRPATAVGPGHLTESVLNDVSVHAVVCGAAHELWLDQREVDGAVARYWEERSLVTMMVELELLRKREEDAFHARLEDRPESRVDVARDAVARCRAAMEELEAEAHRYRLDAHARAAGTLREGLTGLHEHASQRRAEVVGKALGLVRDYELLKLRARVAALRRIGDVTGSERIARRLDALEQHLSGS